MGDQGPPPTAGQTPRPKNILQHDNLGRLRGLQFEDGTVQYRGIKYANIPGRWQAPILNSERLGESEFDATKFGPSCPQKAGGMQFHISLVGDVKLDHEVETYSESECLNLVVTVPPGVSKEEEKLPVMVWVHGGGLSIGSISWPQYDLRRVVSLSSRLGKPFIGVSLKSKKNISGFGGDPTKVTAFGESAGAICLSTLLCMKEPLFSKAMLMSGDTTLRRIRKMTWQNRHCESNVKMLGLEDASPQERLDSLKSMKSEDIVAKLPITQHWSPAVEPGYLEEVDLGILGDRGIAVGKPAWCKEIVVGDMAQDGTVLKSRFLDDPNAMQRLLDALAEIFTPAESEMLLTGYRLNTKPATEDRYKILTQLVSDLRFHLPVLKVAEGWEGRRECCHRYHFHQPNPVKGTYTGKASHELDVGYLLQNFNEHFPADDVKLAEQMAEKWIDFAYGKGWSINEDKHQVLVIGPDGKMSYTTRENYDLEYRQGHGELMLKLGWQRCFKLGELLQGCWSED